MSKLYQAIFILSSILIIGCSYVDDPLSKDNDISVLADASTFSSESGGEADPNQSS